MKVETYRRATGETMVEIGLWPGHGISSLTIPEAVELYTKLTHILESEHNAGRLERYLPSADLEIGGES
jgi:hypothetical protein